MFIVVKNIAFTAMAEKLRLRFGLSGGTQSNKPIILGHVGVGEGASVHPYVFHHRLTSSRGTGCMLGHHVKYKHKYSQA